MDALSHEDMGADRLDQRHQGGRRRAHPVGQRRHVEIDAFPRIDSALTVERQMKAVLGEQDVGEELRPRPSARDRVRWGGRLADRFAGPAGELLAHMLDHLPLARNELQRLGHVLADLTQCRAAAARAGQGRWIDDPIAGQMVRQWSACWPPPFERRHGNPLACRRGGHLARGVRLRRIRLQIGELQLELIKQRTALR
jgi:hypothetical protein